ncbi:MULTISPECIES: 3-oxoacyl-[acyl-carrier-protein] reductase [Porphyromonas]|uniref:3-oxoacyl-[acyl-carrier-protein] reductase n=1 Tax=Porphyromonas canoris TaxID=36875 RepID=A0ABR4XLN4_9PORP|nr:MULTISPECIES: 3-oxoacyl-[acyl-carrier-protein] reductase [Porphyromonas]KGN69257.1 3-ketoacyl-ACP reductase [Porphyromonas sp. COT-108 OH1349]KGN92561.1 3-ketoacyl-ACP reductase [Porphyromonas canoris]
MKLLEGKVALVTGGSRGIGKGIAIELAKHGASVAFTGRSLNANTEAVEQEIANLGVKGKAYASDAADFTAAHQLVEEVMKDFGKIDILVNNAGITQDGLLMRMTESQWDDVLNVNLKSAFNLTHAVTPIMMRARQGSIINLGSVVGISGNTGQANYAASKAGLIGFSKSVAKELGSRGIRVNVIAPGFIETDMTAELPEESKKQWVAGLPLKRAGQPEDIAGAVVFFASDLSSYVTGQVLPVCGGMEI